METETKIKTISYSAISTYLQCPLKYKLTYIDALEPEFTTDALVLGHTIHEALEVCMKKFQLTGTLMGCVDLQNAFSGFLSDELKKKKVRYNEGWSPNKLRRMGMNMLSFWRSAFQNDSNAIKEVIAVEHRFCLDANDPISGMPLSRKITGVIDLILKLHKRPGYFNNQEKYPWLNAYLLLDHKTAVQKFPEIKIDRDLQLTIYQWAALKLGLIPDRDLTIVGFSVLHKKVTPEFNLYLSRRTEQQEIQLLRLISHVLDAIDFGIFYPNFNQINCKNCPFLDDLCPNW